MRTTKPGEKQYCASVWILSKGNPKKMLLLHHKKFDKWLQPGGHIEEFENPIEAAIREVREETGMDISFIDKGIEKLSDGASFLPVPTYIIEQPIPAHKDQPDHWHVDINYVVELDEQALTLNTGESHDIGWFTKTEALALPIHEDTKVIIEKLL